MTMKRTIALTTTLVLAGCSGDDTTGASPDASTHADATTDTGSAVDSGGGQDAAAGDTGTGADANDGGSGHDAADDACPGAWTTAPTVAPAITLPADGGGVVLHAGAIGTQNYTCEQVAVDGGTAYAWVFVGPEADLSDCHAAKIGQHFASDAGAAAPEWQTSDGTYVVGKKIAAFTPDGGASAIPWLLVQETSNGGTGTLSKAGYIQRLNTDGGIAPAITCDASNVGTTQKVSYTADYFFFGTP
jgi:Protein of unknown function (DUF3455)